MPWPPAAKFFVGAVVTLGVGYLIFHKPKPRYITRPPPPEAEPEPEPEPEPDFYLGGIPVPRPTPEPTIPGMEGLAPAGTPPNWQSTFNDNVMATIEEGKASPDVITGEDMKLFVSSKIFPRSTWPPPPEPATGWQQTVWSKIAAILFELSGAANWPFAGIRETIDTAITFWISADKSMQMCAEQGLPGAVAIRRCAALAMYPNLRWPPPEDARPWQHEAWNRLVVYGTGEVPQ